MNLSEFYFDNVSNAKVDAPDDPTRFEPMHPYVRDTFKKRFGFDPAELCYRDSRHYWKTHPADWQKFVDFRADMLHEIYRDTLRELQQFQYGDRKLGRRDIVVTAYDTINNPSIQRDTGADIRDVIALMSTGAREKAKTNGDRFDFELNVEDPQSHWNDSPDRYIALGKLYQHLLPNPNKLALDLNIIDLKRAATDHRFATSTPLGLEAMEMVQSARSVAPRVIIYGEQSISPIDTGDSTSPSFCSLGCASASVAQWKECPGGYSINTPGTLYLRGQDDDHQVAINDDALLVNDRGEVALPPGKHQLQIRDDLIQMAADIPVIHLLSISGTMEEMQAHNGHMRVVYTSGAPCLLSFDEKPTHIFLDDKPWRCEILEGTGAWSIRCPSGHHAVRIFAQDPSLFIAQEASVISSWIIVLFGGSASIMLLVLIGFTHLGRLRDLKTVEEG